MEKIENDDKVVVPAEKHYADFTPAVAPIAPDGGFAMGFGIEQPPAPLTLSPLNMVCLRGPCRHYWHLVTLSGEGNPKGTFEALGLPAPRQHHHTCLANPGMETDLTDDNVFVCSRWDPMTAKETTELDLRRRMYERVANATANDPQEEIDEGDDDGSDAGDPAQS